MLRRVFFTPELLMTMTRGKFEVVRNPIPDDARFKGAGWDWEHGAVFVDFQTNETGPHICEAPDIQRLEG